jgi:hypothetical protein
LYWFVSNFLVLQIFQQQGGAAMSEQITRDEYLLDFPSGKVREEALKQALDIRKFEIDLYWKRATYFWAFIAASFAGYFALQSSSDPANIYIVACLGFLFSLAWYLVNRGSGAWQRNWEKHVDLLEDEIMGPLYKTLMNRRIYRLRDIAEPYAFSPSRINNLLSFGIMVAWLILIMRTLFKAWSFLPFQSLTIVAMTVFTVSLAIVLIWRGYPWKEAPQIPIASRR